MLVCDFISPKAVLGRMLFEHMQGMSVSAERPESLVASVSLAQARELWRERQPHLVLIDDSALEGLPADFMVHVKKEFPDALFFVLACADKDFGCAFFTEVFVKPVRLSHLAARLVFFGRMAAVQAREAGMDIGSWVFVPAERLLRCPATQGAIRLTGMEAGLLEFLSRADKAVDRAEILANVWRYEEGVDTHTLETHIYRLRRKLGPIAAAKKLGDPFLVEGGGYRLNPTWLQP